MVFLNTDTPKFYLMTNQIEDARKVIRRIYVTGDDELKEENIMKFFQVTSNQENTHVSMKEALFTNDKYTRSSWVCIVAMIFQCLTGYYAIIAYSTHLLEDLSSDGGGLTPRVGAILILLANLLGNMASIWYVAKFGRRTIFISGQAIIALSLFSVGILAVFELETPLLIFICLVSFGFQMTLGPIVPLYAAEVCTDVALGAVMIAEDVVVTMQDLLTPILIDTALGPQGVFFIFSGFSVIGLIYVYKAIAEIADLSDAEKKEIYMPGATWGRPLKEGEECHAGDEHKTDLTVSMMGLSDRHPSFLTDINMLKSADTHKL